MTLMNPIYKNEVRTRLQRMGLRPGHSSGLTRILGPAKSIVNSVKFFGFRASMNQVGVAFQGF
jgi:hypothetical protein